MERDAENREGGRNRGRRCERTRRDGTAAKTEALQAGICSKELLKQKDLCWLFKSTSEKP